MRNKEIDIIRSILTVVVITFHAFCPYFTKTWALAPAMSEGNICIYTYIGHTLYNGMLETFVLLSGFLFANKQEAKLTISFCKKKLTRLYLPCLLWGSLFSVLFSPKFDIMNIANGIGHLWFLPMLLWLFIIEQIVNKLYSLRFHEYHIILILFFIALLPFPTLPLGLNKSLYYLPFFHCGILINRKYNLFLDKIQAMNILHIALFAMCCAFAIIAITETESPSPGQGLVQKMFLISRSHLIYALGAISAIPLYWKIAISVFMEGNNKNLIQNFAKCSFGIYIIQEFGLRILYYKTSFCTYLGDISPVFSVPIILATSWILTSAFMRHNATKFIIGS